MHLPADVICIVLLSLLVGACTPPTPQPEPGDICAPPAHKVKDGEISPMSFEDFFLKHQSGELLLIDARHPWFYSQGRIPGAINLATGETLEGQLQALLPKIKEVVGKGHEIVVYCNGFGCHDARTVSRAIAREGFNLKTFGGGWKEWKNNGLPIESASQEVGDLSPQPAP